MSLKRPLNLPAAVGTFEKRPLREAASSGPFCGDEARQAGAKTQETPFGNLRRRQPLDPCIQIMEADLINHPIYKHACALQEQHFHVEQSHFRQQCNEALFRAAQLAAHDCDEDKGTGPVQVVPAGTGTGKSTFTLCLIAANLSADPRYTAAMATGTVREAQAHFDNLAKIVAIYNLGIYSAAHAGLRASADPNAHGDEVARHLRTLGPSRRESLRSARVVICTHELWFKEEQDGEDYGVRRFGDAHRRTHVFLDEQPEAYVELAGRACDLDYLADELGRLPMYDEQAALVRRAADAVRERHALTQGRVAHARFFSPADLPLLEQVDAAAFPDADEPDKLKTMLHLAKCDASGRAFTRQIGSAVKDGPEKLLQICAYYDRFRSHPGLVVLDATAKHDPRWSNPIIPKIGVPSINHVNLIATHIAQPKAFSGIASRAASRLILDEFFSWAKDVVLQHTERGESVLVVLPKKVRMAGGPSMIEKLTLAGRTVHFANWGMGIGSNAWRLCSVVFLFSEHHLPRHVYLGQDLALTGVAIGDAALQSTNGQTSAGSVRLMEMSHRLRWLKQMACRGSIRNLDQQGVASAMRLYTTMDRTVFAAAFDSLFPGAPPPTFIGEISASRTQGDHLAQLLEKRMKPRIEVELAADDIQSHTGISPKDIKRVWKSAKCLDYHYRGWAFQPGQGNRAKPSLIYRPVVVPLPGGFRSITL